MEECRARERSSQLHFFFLGLLLSANHALAPPVSLVCLVGLDHGLHQIVPHHVGLGKPDNGDLRNVLEHLQRLQKAALLAVGQVGLGRVCP